MSTQRRSGAAPARSPRARPEWRRRLDQFGGLTTVVVVVGVLVVLAAVAWQQRPRAVSSEDLQGEARAIVGQTHVATPGELVIPVGEPPSSGPHYARPLRAGTYEQPVDDGNAIHSLEHGMIWITYNPELLEADGVALLDDIQGDHGRDVILSPRPANDVAIAAVSWGRILRLDSVNRDALEDFIRVNLNRSPEPGVR